MVMEEVTAKVSLRGDVESTGGGGGGGNLVLAVNNNNLNVNSTGDNTLSVGGGGGNNNNNNGGNAPAGPSSNFYVIGLEFVRQYYTVLHQGPLYLHRFYSEDSSFVHDDSRVVYGQGDIRERIQQLNFRNCVAKILQVDSHETLGNGVVIQVRGELSNNGQPMKRFMQTFVLAPQTPKRFYVRNDIFHYQDEGLVKDDLKPSSPVESTLTQEDPEEKSDEEIDLTEDLSLPNTVLSIEEVGVERVVDVCPVSRDEIINPVPVPSVSPPVAEVSLLDSKVEVSLKTAEVEPRKTSHGFLLSADEDSTAAGTGRGPPSKEHQEQVHVAIPAAAKTYANLFKSALPAPSTQTQQQQFPALTNRNPFPPPPTTKEPITSPGVSAAEMVGNDAASLRSPPTSSPQPPICESSSGRGLPPRGQGFRGSSYRGDRRDGRDNRERLTSRSSTTMNDDTGSIDGDNRRPINTYPDSQQLFVGNLPHTVTAGEIKDIFAHYGKVADVKILRPNQKKAGTTVPYFSFVVFEEASAAHAAIQEKSKITMKMSDGSNRRLNVEEKHARGDGSDNRSFTSGGGSTSGGYFPRSENATNIPGLGQGVSGGGGNAGNNKTYVPRGGGNQGRTGSSGGEAGGGSGGRGGGTSGGSEHRGHPVRTHSRTFRGSNRGGGERGGGGGATGGGGGTGAR